MKKIILASNNPDKIKELKEILKNLDYKIISKSEAGRLVPSGFLTAR